MQQNFNREQWLADGWKRGAFIDIKAAPEVLQMLPTKLSDHIDSLDQAYLIPMLYDCALVDERFDIEPWAQVLICWPCKPDANFKFGKNPRRYHFPIDSSEGELYMEVTALGFCQVDREALLTAVPVDTIYWPRHGLDKLLNWASERTRQPTFPDEWNKRMAQKDKQLKKLWKDKNFVDLCSGVYLNIQPFCEIEPQEPYKVSAYITVPLEGRALREFNKSVQPELLQKLGSILHGLDNVEVMEVDTINEDQFTKAMERQYQRWQLEYYSYKDDPIAPLPPELEISRDVG